MTSDIQMNSYNPKDVARQLDISESTLRKYNLLLEDEGWNFTKNERGQRAYYDSDIIALRKMIDLKNNGMTLERASSVVYETLWNADMTLTIMDKQGHDERYYKLIEMMQQQQESIQKQTQTIERLTERLDQQQNYINESINDRDKKLMLTLNEIMETKKQVAIAEESKGFFARLFKK